MRIIVALGSLALLAAMPAAAQDRTGLPAVGADGGGYRTGLPQVQEAKPKEDPDAGQKRLVQDFEAWNQRQKRPRMLLFWNRVLTDETTTRYRDRSRGVAVVAENRNVGVAAFDGVRETERTTGGARGNLRPDESSEYESGYVSAFLRAGANIVDRNALMRKVSAQRGADDRADQQYIETLALEAGVDYLVEVLPEYRSDTETGFLFTVKITHLPTSSVKAQFRTEALPAGTQERWVARPGGFQREADDSNTPERIADALAAETMERFL